MKKKNLPKLNKDVKSVNENSKIKKESASSARTSGAPVNIGGVSYTVGVERAKAAPRSSDTFKSAQDYADHLSAVLPQNKNGNAVSNALAEEKDRLRREAGIGNLIRESIGDAASWGAGALGAIGALHNNPAVDSFMQMSGEEKQKAFDRARETELGELLQIGIEEIRNNAAEGFSRGRQWAESKRTSEQHARADQYQQRMKGIESAYQQALLDEHTARTENAISSAQQSYAADKDFADYAAAGQIVQNEEFNPNAYAGLQRSIGNDDMFDVAASTAADTGTAAVLFERSLANPLKYAQDHAELLLQADIAGNTAAYGLANADYLYMTDEEAQYYNYCIGKGGREMADRYFSMLSDRLAARRAEHQYQSISEWAKEHPWAASAVSVGTNLAQPISAVGTAANAVGNLFSDVKTPLDPNSDIFTASRVTNALREGTMENMSKGWQKFLYGTGMSMADCAAQMAVFGPQAAGYAMASNAAGATAYDAAQRGIPSDQALALAAVAGITEFMTEKLPIERLFKLTEGGTRFISPQVVSNILKQSGIEATEELCSSYSNLLTDIMLSGNNSEYNRYIESLMQQGMSREEAEGEAMVTFFVEQPMQDAAGGALSGFGFGTFGSAYGDIATRAAGGQLDAAEVANAARATGDAELARRAAIIEQQMHSGRVDNFDVGALQIELNRFEELSENERRLRALAPAVENGTATTAQNVTYKVLSGEELTTADLRRLYADKRAMSELDKAVGTRTLQKDYSRMAAEIRARQNAAVSQNEQHSEAAALADERYERDMAALEEQRGLMAQAQNSLNSDTAVGQYFDNAVNAPAVQRANLNDEASSIMNRSAAQTAPDIAQSFRRANTEQKVKVGRGSDFESADISNLRKRQLAAAENVMQSLGITADIDVNGDIFAQTGAQVYKHIKNSPAVSRAMSEYFGGQWTGFSAQEKADHAARFIGEAVRKEAAEERLNFSERAVMKAVENVGRSAKVAKRQEDDINSPQNRLAGAKVELDYAQMKAHEYGNERFGGTKETRDRFDMWNNEVKRLQKEVARLEEQVGENASEDAVPKFMTRRNDYSLSMTKQEWARFYKALSGSENVGLRVGSNAVLLYNGDNIENSKLICYKRTKDGIKVVDAFLFESFDETIHEDIQGAAEIIAEAIKYGREIEIINRFSKDYEETYGTVFRRYDPASAGYVEITGEGADSSVLREDKGSSERSGDTGSNRADGAGNSEINGAAHVDNDVRFSASRYDTERDESDYSDYDAPITAEDVEILRSIGRKSINDFSAEDTKKSQKWAYKFWQQIGTKSPFFRAWFGDWRAYDKTSINVIDNVERIDLADAKDAPAVLKQMKSNDDIPSGDFVNNDTGFTIQVGQKVINDTLAYASRSYNRDKNFMHFLDRISALRGIDRIVENAVLLDTHVVGKDNNADRSFMHTFYTVMKCEDSAYVVRLSVDEFNSRHGDIYRAYNLKNIKITPVAVSQVYKPADTTSASGTLSSTNSISDLFALVKKYDPEFHPREVNPAFLNEDGTPKVFYHGTDAKWTEYDLTKNTNQMWGEGIYLTPDPLRARLYGDNIMAFYVKADTNNRTAKRTGKERDYTVMKNGDILVYSPSQIKSATDNIGTFDKENSDIRFAARGKAKVEVNPRTENAKSDSIELETNIGRINVPTIDPLVYTHGDAELTASYRRAERIARGFGKQITWAAGNSITMDGKSFPVDGGFYYKGQIYLNIENMTEAYTWLFGHELCHDMLAKDKAKNGKSTLLKDYYNLRRAWAERTGTTEQFEARVNDIINNRAYDENDPDAVFEEFMCDDLGTFMMNEDFARFAVAEKRTLWQKITYAVGHFINKLRSFGAKSKDMRELEQLHAFMLSALDNYRAEAQRAAASAKRSLSDQLAGLNLPAEPAPSTLTRNIRRDASAAAQLIKDSQGRYKPREYRNISPAKWQTSTAESDRALANITNRLAAEVDSYGYRKVSDGASEYRIYVTNPNSPKLNKQHKDNIKAVRAFAAATGTRIGFATGSAIMTAREGNEYTYRFDAINDNGTVYVNLDAADPYTAIVGAHWYNQYAAVNPARARTLARTIKRMNKLTGGKATEQDMAVKQITGSEQSSNTPMSRAQMSAEALKMTSADLLATLSGDKALAKSVAKEQPSLIRRALDVTGDMLSRLTGTAEKRAQKLMQQAEANLLYALSSSVENNTTPEGSKISTAKKKPLPEGMRAMYAGESAATADKARLADAQQMLADGADAETVRQQTGWFKGMDGKWRFEIDDSKAVFNRKGFGNISPERLEQIELVARYLAPEGWAKPLTPEEKKIWRNHWENGVASRVKLDEVFNHPELFSAYPELKGIDIYFEYMGKYKHGSYDAELGRIRLNIEKSEAELKDTLIHELQHVVQFIENFASGANPAYWEEMKSNGFDSRTAEDRQKALQLQQKVEQIRSEKPEFYADMMELEKLSPTVPRGAVDWNTLEQLEEDPPEWKRYDAERERLEQKYDELAVWDFIDLQYRIAEANKKVGRSAIQLYYNTAGEIEARDSERRHDYTADLRRTTPPDLGNEDTVFAEDSNESASISSIMGRNGSYGKGVILDTDFFRGIKPRDWGKKLAAYVHKEMAGRELTVYNADGEPETVMLAKSSDRATKTGASNSHKVLDKLARVGGDNIKALGVIHIDELAQTSKYENTTDEHNHQWLDEHGWEYRKAYAIDRTGAIYEMTLNIAKGRDRNILYAINKIKKVDDGVVPSTRKGRGSHININSAESIPHTSDSVKFSALRNPTREENRAWLDEYSEQYGAIPEGENVNSRGNRNVPKQIDDDTRTRQTVRTYLEALTTPDEVVGELERDIVNGRFAYTPVSNRAANQNADRVLARGYDEAMAQWQGVVHGDRVADKKAIALGERLIIEAANRGDTAAATRMIAEVAAEATRAGQIVQAISMVKRLSPTGQLLSIQRQVNRLNDELAGRGKEVSISEEKLQEFTNIAKQLEKAQQRISELEEMLANGVEHTEHGYAEDELTDVKEQEQQLKKKLSEARNDIIKDVAEQVPPSWVDKLNAWRYLAMLGNPRTHIRNLVGNAVFIPTVKLKQAMAAGLEHLFVKKGDRTQSINASKSLREFAAQDAAEQLEWLKSGGKYNATDEISEQTKAFSDDNVVGKALNKISDFNSWALDAEDGIFLKYHYQTALAGYAAANGISAYQLKTDAELLQKARAFAAREAQRATYRDMNAFSDFMTSASSKLRKKKGAGGALAYAAFEGVVPFKKTPCNIVKRSIEYSPIGVMTALSKGARKLANNRKGIANDYTASEFINDLSAGMTGTMIVALGALLSSLGMLRGRNKDKEDEFEKLQGAQEYSLVINDWSYTIDWMSPVSLPLFVGAELHDQIVNTNEELTLKSLLDSLVMIAEPIFNLSMMDGVQSVLQSYSSEGAIMDMFTGAVESFAGQMFPTVGGQIARTIDPKSRNAYYNDKNSSIPDFISQTARSAMSKMPFLQSELPERIDAWGRNSGEGQGLFERVAENFFSPGYYSKSKTTEVDRVIQQIYEETGDSSILPANAGKYFSYNSKNYYMSADEYVTYAKTRGQTAYNIIDDLRKNSKFNELSAEEKAACVSDAYKLATVIAKCGTDSGYTIADAYVWQREAYESGEYAKAILARR